MTGNDKFLWTRHAWDKMRFYRLTESRLKRIIRHPARTEEAVLEGAVACMQPAFASATADKPVFVSAAAGKLSKKYSEIWVMYVLVKDAASRQFSSDPRKNSPARNFSPRSVALFSAFGRKTMPGDGSLRLRGASRVLSRPHEGLLGELPRPHPSLGDGVRRIKVITAWRYPGKSPERNPIPAEILREVRNIL